MNEYEKACKEFLKGCPDVPYDQQEDCQECLVAFTDHIRMLASKEGYKDANCHCIHRVGEGD